MTWLRRSAEAGALDLGGHMLLTTFRANGEPVSTPVWNLVRADGTIAMWTAAGTGKWKRIQRNPQVTVQACDPRGRVKKGAVAHSGSAQMLPDGAEAEQLRAEIMRSHRGQVAFVKRIARLQGRLKADQEFGDTIIVITLDQPPIWEITAGSRVLTGVQDVRGRPGVGPDDWSFAASPSCYTAYGRGLDPGLTVC